MKKKSIICRVKGGLGNQMFIYAAARNLAILNKADLILDNLTGFKYDKLYKRNFKLDAFEIQIKYANKSEMFLPFDKVCRKIKSILFNKDFYVESNLDFDETFLNIKHNGKLWIEGYWQNEKYFIDIKEAIKRDFTFKNVESFKCENYINLIHQSNSVAIHLRNFNTNTNDITIKNLDINYYVNSLEFIINNVENPLFFIFVEHPSLEQKTFINKINNSILINTSSDIIDLYLMSNCKHFIIANSTFSWWAAWLSDFENKIVIAPKKKKINENSGFSSVTIPDNWLQF